jgi:hypothetical protein
MSATRWLATGELSDRVIQYSVKMAPVSLKAREKKTKSRKFDQPAPQQLA